MKYIKTYEKKTKQPEYYDIYDDLRNIKDVDYYLNLLHTKNISDYNKSRLFYWSCRELPELALKLFSILPINIIIENKRGIAQLDYLYFSKILRKNDLYKLLIVRNDFIHDVLYYSNDDTKKLILLKKLGYIFTQKNLESFCYTNKINSIKYLVNQGLDPAIKDKANYGDMPQNCLDIATRYSDKNIEVIKYLVQKLNIPVTYRHIDNVISKRNLDAVPILINAKKFIDDYSYSRYATHEEDKYEFRLNWLIHPMLNNGLDEYLKILLKRKNVGYSILQSLPYLTDGDFINRKNMVKYLDPKYLDFAYEILNNYDGKYENDDTTIFITHKNEKYWLKKMKKNPSIIYKLTELEDDFKNSYQYQKTILDADPKNVKYIIKNLNPRIMYEYDHIPEILDKSANKYNL
jgi:hypothetical protein